MNIINDRISMVNLSAGGGATRDSRTIASQVHVRLARASRMRFDQLLDAAECADRELEAMFARDDLLGAMAAGELLRDLALRLACGTPGGWSEVERRIRLLLGIRKALHRESSLRAMLDIVIEADCLEWDVVITDASEAAPSLQ